MTDIADLEHRVIAPEAAQSDTTQTLRWVVSKLGKLSAVQDEHTLRLERIESEVSGLRREFEGFRRDLPSLVTEAVREGMKER